MAYSTDPNSSSLYADVKSHLGHFGVVHWDEDKNNYRIRDFDSRVCQRCWSSVNWLWKPSLNTAVQNFGTFGRIYFVLSKFLWDYCKVEGGMIQSVPNWHKLVFESKVKIGNCVYLVTLTDNSCNFFFIIFSTEHVQWPCTSPSWKFFPLVYAPSSSTDSWQLVQANPGLVRMTSFKRFQSAIIQRTNPPRQGNSKSATHINRNGSQTLGGYYRYQIEIIME
jgi:hypothetical protein